MWDQARGIRPWGCEEARVSIGATLAAARRRSGLTVHDVSQSTRVTEPIIAGIEQDDYAECGGDFYARGHIRAIARAVGEDPDPLIEEFDSTWRSAKETTAAEAFGPSIPLRTRERRRVRWTAVLAVLVLAVIGFAGYKFAAGVGQARPAAAASPHPSQAGPGSPGKANAVQSSAVASSPPAASSAPAAASSSPPASTSAPVKVQALAPARVTAFGPAGSGSGDNPQIAAQATAGNPAAPWYSQWYATPGFSGLKTGTGLLVDMGRTVTVTSVRLSLGARPGASVQLRAGAKPLPRWLPEVASAADASGTVQFRPGAPVQVRYLLIWFTKLPADNAGHYQASVYRISVQGQP
jgi:cytoskeletal protein RodZ